MRLTRLHTAIVGVLGGSCALSYQTPALAQDQAQGALEEIVVTATRRAEDLQEVPISIVAVTGDGLQARGIQNIEGLNATIPNLSVMGSAGGNGTSGTSFRVRGIPGVGTYIDGIWQLSTSGMLTEEFVDLDRVEVLRGPQGTLFGRDSVGGAIRIFTKRPADEFGATFKGTLGTFDRHDAQISADLPFSDTVKSKWTFASLNRDGYITSQTTGNKGGGIDESVTRGDLTWTPSDKFDLRAQFSRTESEFTEPRVQDAVWSGSILFPTNLPLMYNAAGLPYDQDSQMAGWPGGQVGKWENRSQITLPNRIVTDQASLDIKLNLSDAISLDFLTGYTNQTNKVFVDYDDSEYGLVEDTINGDLDMFSEEIQLSGGGDRVQWVAGLFYWNQEGRTRAVRYAAEEFNDDPTLHTDNQRVADLFATPYCQSLLVDPPPGPSSTCQDSMAFYKGFATIGTYGGIGGSLSRSGVDGYAVFGEVTLALTDKFTLALGARQHSQDNENQVMTPINAAPRYTNQDFARDPLAGRKDGRLTPSSFDKATGRVSARYQFTDSVMGYVSFAQGFNSGGGAYINEPVTNNPILYQWKPETLNNLEVGLRSDLAGGRVRFNATLFDTVWDDIQAALALRYCNSSGDCFDLPSVVTQNIGKAEAKGAEFELTYAPTRQWLFNVNLGLLDTGFTDIYVANAAGYVAGETEFSQAPETTANVGIQYDADLSGGGMLSTRLDYTYTSQYWRQFDPSLRTAWYPGVPEGWNDETGDFGLVNMRLTYTPRDAQWDLAVFGTNLTDEYILNSGFFHGLWGFDFATVARPREFGTSIVFHF
jgi:iron complex outermembrane receptor protein